MVKCRELSEIKMAADRWLLAVLCSQMRPAKIDAFRHQTVSALSIIIELRAANSQRSSAIDLPG